jgi:radical SAM superfamily enzyme YgiQ (UPF0313 family)
MGAENNMKFLFCNAPFYSTDGLWHGIRSGCQWQFTAPNGIDKKPLEQNIDCYYQTFPFHLAFAGAILKEYAGNECIIYDAIALQDTYVEFYQRVQKEKPDKIVLEIGIPSFEQDVEILQNLKLLGYYVIIVGFTWKVPEGIADEVWEGNYWITLLELYGKKYPQDLPTPIRPDNSLMYNDYHSFGRYIKKPQMQVWATLGCPHSCNFCWWRHTITKGRHDKRPIASITKEIQEGVDRWNIKSVLFNDDSFNIGNSWCHELSVMMKKFKLQWSGMCRFDGCSMDAYKEMHDAGCVSLKIGVETFQQRLIDKMGKKLNTEKLLEGIIKLVDMGYFVYLSTMKKIYGQTEEEMQKDTFILDELYKIGVRYQRTLMIPLHGTPLYNEYLKDVYNLDEIPYFEFSRFDNDSPIIRMAEDRWKKSLEVKK